MEVLNHIYAAIFIKRRG